jgi:hypothetical protein
MEALCAGGYSGVASEEVLFDAVWQCPCMNAPGKPTCRGGRRLAQHRICQ